MRSLIQRVAIAPLIFLLACLYPFSADAQVRGGHVEKIANKRLSGTAIATVPNLSFAECEARCLSDPACVAIEHFRGGRVFNRRTQCKILSTVGEARDNNYADIGYRRGGPGATAKADKKSSPKKSAAASELEKSESDRSEQAQPAQKPQESAGGEELKSNQGVAPFSLDRSGSSPGSGGSGIGRAVETAPTLPPPRPARAAEAPPPAPTAPRAGAPAAPVLAPSSPAPVAAAPPPPAPIARTRSITRTEAPRGDAAPQPSDWDIVPVFYGTDRNRRDQPKRIAYGSDRARKLEIGQALVTVPKSHQVPNVERPWAIKIPYIDVTLYQESEDPKRHFTLQELRELTKEDMLRLVRERLAKSANFKDQALVIVHGYNNGFDDALYRTAQIAYDLKYDGAPFLYSWPSGGGITSYPYDRESAQQAEQYLSRFLLMVLNETGAKGVSLIAHSMGNQPLLQVLRDLRRTNPEVSRINQVILAAPDVDRDTFEYLAGQIRGIGQGITMYVSSNDVALGVSRRFAGGIPRAGDVPEGLGPTVVNGVDTIDISGLSTDYFALNHSAYAEKTALLQDIEVLLRTGQRPPEKRLSTMQRIVGDKGDYWRYSK